MSENHVQRFLLDDLDIRGAIVHLGPVWRQLLAGRDYPAAVIGLLGQMSVTTLLLADNLKQQGRLTIQLRGDGLVPLLVIDCDDSLNIRCMAQHEPDAAIDESMTTPEKLIGSGQLLLSLDLPSMREPYQSIVPLTGNSIAEIFENYLGQSEQLDSRFFLAATPDGAAGLFLQKMPGADARDEDGWTRIEALAATVKADELLDLPGEQLLTRLFNEEAVRVFAAREVTSNTPENREKVGTMLLSLGREEIYSALAERGEIVVRDDLSNREYRFDKAAIDELFANTPATPPTVH
jgi:molecular chaperone Hsp33